jgi:hypothetical protein
MTVLGEGCPGVLDSKEFRTLVIFARNFRMSIHIGIRVCDKAAKKLRIRIRA